MRKPAQFESAFEVYQVMGVLGEGGVGIVYLAKDSQGTQVAIKCMTTAISSSQRRRFQNEIAFCLVERHPGVVRVLDWGFLMVDGTKHAFYVMPLYQGTLDDALKGATIEQKLQLFAQLLDAVDALHRLGALHRDLKPKNILWSAADRKLLVADFGCAKLNEDLMATAVETVPGDKLGNRMFSAPEQKAGGSVDARADIYALGIILNYMFTGEVLQGVGYKTISAAAPEVAHLDSVVDRMVQSNASARPATIAEVKNKLAHASTEFASRQRLDSLRQVVVPDTGVDGELVANPLAIVGYDYRQGELILKLNRVPPTGWPNVFAATSYTGSAYMGSEPRSAKVAGAEIRVRANEQTAANILSFYRQHIVDASRAYQAQLERIARQQAEQKKLELEKERAEEEERQRVFQKLGSL